MSENVLCISPFHISIVYNDGDNDTDDDAVYVCTGGAVPLAEGGVCLLGSVGAMKSNEETQWRNVNQ